jgi:hypothetical protein
MGADTELIRGIIAELAHEFFDRPVMSNLTRPAYVERLIARALSPGWRHVGGDWAGWDLESDRGVRLEVKQSAMRQTWTDGPTGPGRAAAGIFDIAPRTGYWTPEGKWVRSIGRLADVYVFAHHPVFDLEQVDHRDPEQWVFHVVPEHRLPGIQRTIRLPWLQAATEAVRYAGLKTAVADTVALLPKLKGGVDLGR